MRKATKNIWTINIYKNSGRYQRQVLTFALSSGFKDYEDGVLHAAAIKAEAEAVVTRNIKDFATSELPVFTPEEFILKSPDSCNGG